jgi:hypothetical protein
MGKPAATHAAYHSDQEATTTSTRRFATQQPRRNTTKAVRPREGRIDHGWIKANAHRMRQGCDMTAGRAIGGTWHNARKGPERADLEHERVSEVNRTKLPLAERTCYHKAIARDRDAFRLHPYI